MVVCLQVPLFQNTEIGFTKLLALSIKPRLFLSKEYIVKKGDIGSEVEFSYQPKEAVMVTSFSLDPC